MTSLHTQYWISDTTLVTNKLLDLLQLQGKNVPFSVNTVNGRSTDEKSQMIDLQLMSLESGDQHLWAPVISEVAADTTDHPPRTWDAASDFFGPQPAKLSRLEQLAQILLISNETVFVD